ncbi:hypothetical protein nbrc107696_03290 [Gordonia spumicola]|uniref:Uncharacterized protein n=1 Tax=Gordonia spumicola TaxID=589161 RepID=A0A7I9V3X0_9ACTN|nr:hypothetical protein nbrc107696_03290 [Gordonia spumicola]
MFGDADDDSLESVDAVVLDVVGDVSVADAVTVTVAGGVDVEVAAAASSDLLHPATKNVAAAIAAMAGRTCRRSTV